MYDDITPMVLGLTQVNLSTVGYKLRHGTEKTSVRYKWTNPGYKPETLSMDGTIRQIFSCWTSTKLQLSLGVHESRDVTSIVIVHHK